MDNNICFVFICQEGELEAQAVLLAISLRYFLQEDHELVAAIPVPASRWGVLSEQTVEALKLLNVRTVEVINQISDDYPIGNKNSCLAIKTDCKRIVFLDSDIIMMRGFDEQNAFEAPISAVPESGIVAHFDEWEQLYSKFNLTMPKQRMTTSYTKVESLPYANTGLIAINHTIDKTSNIAAKWIESTNAIRSDISLPQKLRGNHLDQISFPIASASCGIDIEFLDVEWNYPSWEFTIDSKLPPVFFHYQYGSRLARERVTAELVEKLCVQNPAYEAAVSQHQSFRLVLYKIPFVFKKAGFYVNLLRRALQDKKRIHYFIQNRLQFMRLRSKRS
jgi:hypothetical protein